MSSENDYQDDMRNELPALIQTLERFLDLKKWGFVLFDDGDFSLSFPGVFYQSDKCKIRFILQRDRPYDDLGIDVTYGRLHAPLNQNRMVWNGEQCHCWHSIEKVLNFLDGLSPGDVDNKEFVVPHIIYDFYQSNKDKRWNTTEHAARKHAFIWEHYGQRLFDLFDLRRSDLWTEYSDFLEKYYQNRAEQTKLKGLIPISSDPPFYKIC